MVPSLGIMEDMVAQPLSQTSQNIVTLLIAMHQSNIFKTCDRSTLLVEFFPVQWSQEENDI